MILKPPTLFACALLTTACAALPSNSLLPLRRRAAPNPAPLKTSASNTPFGSFYDAEVTFGNQTFLLIADTGSSDTWVVGTGYQCFNLTTDAEVPQESCAYAEATYDASPTFERIANQTFGVQYGAGVALGIMGYEDVTLGGITVRRQEVGVADRTALAGDGLDSGVLGLGYPLLTSAHPGTEPPPTDSLLLDKIPYDPLLFRMHKQGSMEPWFSLSLERLPRNATTGAGGYLGLGTLPPVDHDETFVRAPVEITEAIPLALTNGTRVITEWTLGVEAVTWGSGGNNPQNPSSRSTNATRFQAVVDSGNYFNQLPDAVAAGIHAAYDPPAELDAQSGQYVVRCDTVPPALGVTIAGRTFYHLPEDLVLQRPDGVCVSPVLPSVAGFHFLGDIFMRNVVSVFDFGAGEMRFAARADGGGSAVAAGNGSADGSPGPATSSAWSPVGSGVSVGMAMVSVIAWVFVL